MSAQLQIKLPWLTSDRKFYIPETLQTFRMLLPSTSTLFHAFTRQVIGSRLQIANR